jgi:long-chain acyl-CoA synthetase
MASQLDSQLAAIIARITAPGAPFETAMFERDGLRLPVFVNAPATLGDLFAHFCTQHGEAEFLIDGDVRLTFGETLHLARRTAGGLAARHAVRAGSRVGIAARNSANWIIAYMGVVMAGGIATLLNGWCTGAELAECIAMAECDLVLADPARMERLQGEDVPATLIAIGHGAPETGLASILAPPGTPAPEPGVGPDDFATILFTSGSTGTAKAALSDHRAVVHAALNYAAQSLMVYTQMGEAGTPVPLRQSALVTVPLFHVTGEVAVFLQSFVIGRKLVIMAKWDAIDAMWLIEQEGVTYFVGVPLMSYEIATHPERDRFDLSTCRSFAAGGAPRPPEHVARIREALPHAWPLLGYGLTETNAVGCGNFNENHQAKPDSTGPASKPLVELAVFGTDGAALPAGEVGEIAIRSICNFRGYHGNPEATAAAIRPDGFVLTGDLGRIDTDGYLFVVDRKKDIIIRGGENIACVEVEQAIYAHPAVAEVSVFGLPDPHYGEVPVAVWHAKNGHELGEEALRAHVAGRIAAYKVPVRIWREETPLPRLGTEKIDKRALKARYSQGWEAVKGRP